jgi:hypothetical protein
VSNIDALTLANELDDDWHNQSRSFEREAVTRFWGLLTLPARALDPALPRKLLKATTVLRNARFTGSAVSEMFFADQQFTEVDAIFFNVGSPLGHDRGDDAWVVEVERKSGHGHGDYFRAMHRARQFSDLIHQRFGVRARPVVIYEDEGGKLSYKTFDGDVLLITMSTLRERTRGLTFPSMLDIPGGASDRTLVKLAVLRQLVSRDPNVPGGLPSSAALARAIVADGWPLRHPVAGHQSVDALPDSVERWFKLEREDDNHIAARLDKYLAEMLERGLVDRLTPQPRLSYDGGTVALRAMRAESLEHT